MNPADCFKFEVEERVECMQSKKVKYTNRSDYCLSVPVPVEAAINKGEGHLVLIYIVLKTNIHSHKTFSQNHINHNGFNILVQMKTPHLYRKQKHYITQ